MKWKERERGENLQGICAEAVISEFCQDINQKDDESGSIAHREMRLEW